MGGDHPVQGGGFQPEHAYPCTCLAGLASRARWFGTAPRTAGRLPQTPVSFAPVVCPAVGMRRNGGKCHGNANGVPGTGVGVAMAALQALRRVSAVSCTWHKKLSRTWSLLSMTSLDRSRAAASSILQSCSSLFSCTGSTSQHSRVMLPSSLAALVVPTEHWHSNAVPSMSFPVRTPVKHEGWYLVKHAVVGQAVHAALVDLLPQVAHESVNLVRRQQQARLLTFQQEDLISSERQCTRVRNDVDGELLNGRVGVG